MQCLTVDQAKAARDAASHNVRAHKDACHICSAAAARRRPGEMCKSGRGFRQALADANKALTDARAAAAEPAPGSQPLFDENLQPYWAES